MYKELFKLAKKPILWQRSGEAFWDDDHISEMMLNAHLSQDTDAASRRIEVIDRSVKWLSSLIPPNSKVLDLGCGPGLYTKRLSDMGFDVTGVDLSRRSIAYAKNADRKTKYICTDYLMLDDNSTYDMIIMIYCDYAALTKHEREKLLKIINRLLSPNGIFVFDVFTDAHYQGKQNRCDWSLFESGGFWSSEPHICLNATWLYENNTVSADQCVVITENRISEYIIWDTVYTKQRLACEVEASGLSIKGIFSDVCGSDYNENSQTLCCICKSKTM